MISSVLDTLIFGSAKFGTPCVRMQSEYSSASSTGCRNFAGTEPLAAPERVLADPPQPAAKIVMLITARLICAANRERA